MNIDTTILLQRKKIKEIRFSCKKTRKICAILVLLIMLNLTASAMEDAVYSYIVENGEINLISATVPYEWKVFNIATEIDGKPVTSLDNIFKIRQEVEEIRIDDDGNSYRDLWSVKWYAKDCFPYKLKQINVPNTVRKVSETFVHEFDSKTSDAPVISVPDSATITKTGWSYYPSSDEALYRSRENKIEVPKIILKEVGKAVPVYIDGKNTIDGCILYEGTVYIPKLEVLNITNDLEYDRFSYRGYDDLMLYRCYEKNTHKYLNSESVAASIEGAKYISEYKRILFNACAGEMMVSYYYNPIDKKEPYIRDGIKGGEIEVKPMPIYSGYVPLRAICEEIGCDVEWNSEDQSVSIRTSSPY